MCLKSALAFYNAYVDTNIRMPFVSSHTDLSLVATIVSPTFSVIKSRNSSIPLFASFPFFLSQLPIHQRAYSRVLVQVWSFTTSPLCWGSVEGKVEGTRRK